MPGIPVAAEETHPPVYAPSDLAPLAGSLGWKSLAAWAPRNGTEAAHMGPQTPGRRGASICASTRFDHGAGEAVSLRWVGPTGATEDATLLWITSPGPRAPRQYPGSPSRRLSHPKAGEARWALCPETPLRPAEELETFPHVLPTCTEGRQPPGPSREPVYPGDLQRLSRQGGRDPGVITVMRKRRGTERLRDSEEDRTSRASLRAASRASGESWGPTGSSRPPTPSLQVCACVRGCGSHPRPHLL